MEGTAASKVSSKTRALVEGALCVALSIVFSQLRIFSMPQGGSITLEMAPLLYFSYKYGCKWGALAGAISGLLQMVFGGYVAHPAQGLLDYPLAFACMGAAGLFGAHGKRLIAGTVVAALARLACHVLSGAIFFASYAPEGQNVWLYSLIYNASYIVPSLVLTAVAAWFMWKKFPHLA
ncbi:MAG: energy-coupled thiamine transporter ThiT [Synergistaceae bacterium]|jgi:thiamine transporter|nr:energy-coupled thiamine transporter ThiT [Synergistaceae bacterium]